MLFISDVCKNYGHTVALDHVTLQLPDTGLVALSGENGCGKTTLLNLIATADVPTSGSLRYNDLPYGDSARFFLRNLVISYVAQDSLFSEALTVSENLGMAADRAEGQISREMASYHLGEKMQAMPRQLSGGQRQKCSFIRGVIKPCSVLLVDEPTNNMDGETELAVFRRLKELSEDKLVVVVSHHLALMEEYADLVVRMENGRVTGVTDQHHTGDLLIRDGKIYVPSDYRYTSVADWAAVRRALEENRNLTLQLYDPSEPPETAEVPGTADVTEATAPVEQLSADGRRIHTAPGTDASSGKTEGRSPSSGKTVSPMHTEAPLMRSTRGVWHVFVRCACRQAVRTLLTSVFVALFLILSAGLLSLSAVDSIRFTYDFFEANQYEQVNFYHDSDVHVMLDEDKPAFTLDDYLQMRDRYAVRTALLTDFEAEAVLPFFRNGIYTPQVAGFALIDAGQSWPLLCGQAPAGAQVLLTDYLADGLCRQAGNTAAYESLIREGVVLGGYHFEVSGILDTDYEAWLGSWADESMMNGETPSPEWTCMREAFYARIYADDTFLQEGSVRVLYHEMFDYGALFADIRLSESTDASQERDGVLINRAFADLIGDTDSFKNPVGSYSVAGVLEDGAENPAVYVTAEQMQSFLDGARGVDSFNTEVVSLEQYEFLASYRLKHNTPASGTVEQAVEAVQIVQVLLKPAVPVALVLAAALAFLFWLDRSGKDRFILYAFQMYGYRQGQIRLFVLWQYLAGILPACILAIVGYFALAQGINGNLSDLCGCDMILLSRSVLPVLAACGVCFVLTLAAVLTVTQRRLTVPPIRLYTGSGK